MQLANHNLYLKKKKTVHGQDVQNLISPGGPVCIFFFGLLRYQALATGPSLLRSQAEMMPHLHRPIFKPIRFLFAGLTSINFFSSSNQSPHQAQHLAATGKKNRQGKSFELHQRVSIGQTEKIKPIASSRRKEQRSPYVGTSSSETGTRWKDWGTSYWPSSLFSYLGFAFAGRKEKQGQARASSAKG